MRKLAIVGSHTKTSALAPYGDPDYEIWVFNEAPLHSWCTRWDVCLQLHKRENYQTMNNWVNPAYWPFLQEDHGERVIWMQAVDERVPNSRRFPLEEIIETLPGAQFGWFESSPSYAIALALYQGWQEIHIWGIELTSNTEYGYQLHNWQYWIGVACGMGVKIILHSGEFHFAAKRYGYEGEIQLDPEYFKSREVMLDAEWNRAEWATKKAKNNLDDAILTREADKIVTKIVELRNLMIESGRLAGAIEEAQHYQGKDSPVTRQEFERRAATGQKDSEGHRALMYHNSGKAEYVYNVWMQTGNYDALSQMKQFLNEAMRSAYDCGAHLGKFSENQQYMIEYDARLQAAGGEKARLVMMGEVKVGGNGNG